ncbi:MAG: hydroxymethylpyrimidine pyrophosphatase-like HAD family hydrolase [Cognaticolwellia sp.]|jgi:hydroxymethylpyrimidine pyrophosphatase-like HAD family hydrolase
MEMLTAASSRLFVFTDLDDTLFRSFKGKTPDFSIPATLDTQGNTYAYSSIQQQKLLDVMVKADGVIIPVTGRSSRSFLNCQLPVIVNSQYAIVSHGAVILNHQHLLLGEWREFLEQEFELTRWQQTLTTLYEYILAHFTALNNGVRVRLIVDQGITAYICVKISKDNYHQDKSFQVNQFLSSVLKKTMLLHGNGRNFAVLPPYAQKKIAVSFLKEKMAIGPHDTVLGIGDSHSDLPFMADSDFLIVPQQAQIFDKEIE